MDGGDIDHALTVFRTKLIIAHQSLVASSPSKCPLHDPTARLNLITAHIVGTLDDFQTDIEFLIDPSDERTRLLSVRPNIFEAGILGFAPAEELPGSLTVILVSGGNKDAHYPSVGVNKEMPLASFDLLVRVVADVVATGLPPFSVVFTD